MLALVFQFVFLLMALRRYQTFDLWRRRFRVLNRALIVPALVDALAWLLTLEVHPGLASAQDPSRR